MARNWQLLAAAFWGLLTLGILLRDVLAEPASLQRIPMRNWTVTASVCGLLTIWNIARWYQLVQSRRSGAVRTALEPNPEASRGYEYNPEFDFQKLDREQANPTRSDQNRTDGGAGTNP